MAGLTPPTLGLLERAIGYGLCSLEVVTQGALNGPTPCAAWDLRMLLCHVRESLAVLRQGFDAGCVDAEPPPLAGPPAERADDLVAEVRTAAEELLAQCRVGAAGPAVQVGGHEVGPRTLELVGAVEVAVHGWDIYEACGRQRAIPVDLALDLLRSLPLIAQLSIRSSLFAAPVRVSPLASPSDQLVAFLGRPPRHRPSPRLLPTGA